MRGCAALRAGVKITEIKVGSWTWTSPRLELLPQRRSNVGTGARHSNSDYFTRDDEVLTWDNK